MALEAHARSRHGALIVDYITNPVKKRDDYPEMPPQNYLSEEVRLAAAEYMLTVSN